MALTFDDVSHAYGKQPVLEHVNLRAETGEITCLLGPSGGGKSTLLRLAAGLETLQSGRILLDDAVLSAPGSEPPPEARPVGLMFQEIALFPNLTLAENIGFGLNTLDRSTRDAHVKLHLESVGLEDYADRYAHTLSGGQQQRIALARSLAPQPKVLLMDEPYASIDITLRRQLREAARLTLKQNNTTTVLVTHDPTEAMEMADVIAVLDKGRIVQTGSPMELYNSPVHPSVACLFGDAQQLRARQTAEGFISDYGMITYDHADSTTEQACILVVRPVGLEIKKSERDGSLIVMDIRYVGEGWLIFVMPPTPAPSLAPLRILVEELDGLAIGDQVTASARQQNVFVFSD